MAKVTITRCERFKICGNEVERDGIAGIHIPLHHAREIDLCRPCFDTFWRWLNPGTIAPGGVLEDEVG